MAKVKRNIFIAIISALLILSVGLFFGCQKENKGGENPTTLGDGSIVVSEIDGITKYTAKPDEWNVFAGWYDGMLKFSNNATIKVDKDTPDNLVAKFETSGLLSIDRLLNGSYNIYNNLIQTDGDFFNMDYSTSLSIQGKTYSASLDVERGGYFSKKGGFHDYAVVKNGNETLFSQYYVDDTQNSMLYIDYGDRKVAVEDFKSVGAYLIDFPNISQTVWKLKNLVESKVYAQLDKYLGFRNAVGVIGEVENSQNKTRIVLNIDKLLNEFKDKISALDDEELGDFKNLIHTLTSEYEGIANKLPKIVFEIEVEYSLNEEKEFIDKVVFKGTFEENYNFSLNGKLFTIPACTMSCVIENANITLSQTPNAVPLEIIQSFPEAVHAINFQADASLYFLKENVATLELSALDEYKIDFDCELNSEAIVKAIDKDGNFDETKIDWQNLGLLSLKIILKENPEDNEQLSRHNGEKEYLNILIDTSKFGAKALVYVGLYNPKTLNGTATSKYLISGAYDIPALIKYMPDVAEKLKDIDDENNAGAEKLSALQNQNVVASLLSASMKSAISFIEQEITTDQIMFELFVELLKKLFPDNQVVQDGLFYDETFGSTLAVDEVKDLIEDKFAQTDDVLSSLGLQNNLFGNKTTHIAIKAGTLIHGGVVKNQEGEYIDENGKVFADEFNSVHKMLVGVEENSCVSGLDDATFTKANFEDEIIALVGKSVTIENGLFSDGTTSSNFVNCQGNEAKLAMRVYRAEYSMLDEDMAEIKVYLSFSAGTLQSVMVGTFDVPYGLIEYTMQVELA